MKKGLNSLLTLISALLTQVFSTSLIIFLFLTLTGYLTYKRAKEDEKTGIKLVAWWVFWFGGYNLLASFIL